ncbi:MAG TPA: V-type ATPase subunit [Synergistales bacterium]|jgi:V/A-type H+-transporting ATPase subunit C|nr:V-type ATPase subunit [Synergistales bacterium]
MTDPTDYGYAVSRLRAMENRLLDQGVFQRLLDSEDLSSALKVMSETTYGKWLLEQQSAEKYELAIESELKYVFAETEHFVPDPCLYRICRLPYDIHNIKVLLKGLFVQKQGGQRRLDLLTGLGNILVDDLVVAIESEDYRLMPFGFHRTVPECVSTWDQTHDILQVERILDQALFSLQLKMADEVAFEGVKLFARSRVDAENLRNIARLKRMGFDSSQAAPFLHNGGFVPMEKIQALINEPFEGWERFLSFAEVSRTLSGAQEHADLDSLIVDLEKSIDDFLSWVLAKYKYSPFAPENVLHYLWMKEIEAKNVRILLIGIGNGAERTVLRRLLRNV